MGRVANAEMEFDKQFRQDFYPIAEHLRVFEPNISLIIGYHGTGKSMLFRAATENILPTEAIQRLLRHNVLPLARFMDYHIEWLAGYPMGKNFPDPGTLRQFAQAGNGDQIFADLWLAYLARLLSPQLVGDNFGQLFALPSVEVGQIYQVLNNYRPQIINALDELDHRLKQENRWVFISYDELDTLGGTNWQLMALLIRSLLTFWAEYTRRWQRLQAKIFLRTDLFNNAQVFTADFTKLANSRAELSWNERQLYGMLIKRMANSSLEWLAYCQNAGLQFDEDGLLGWIPRLSNAEAARPFVEQLAGTFMGSASNKGRTFTWLLDHLRDGKGKIGPRALVHLVGYAAIQELDLGRANGRQLLHHSSLRRALNSVSDEHIRLLKSREMPWLANVAQRLSNREVPLTRTEWEELLAQDWQAWGHDNQEKQRPPRETPAQMLALLLELGVCRERLDGRIDVPDLFLYGFAIKRRGGVKQ